MGDTLSGRALTADEYVELLDLFERLNLAIDARSALLDRLPAGFVRSLPHRAEPDLQLGEDLRQLHETTALTGLPKRPIAIWLENATRLARRRHRVEAKRLAELCTIAGGEPPRLRGSIAPRVSRSGVVFGVVSLAAVIGLALWHLRDPDAPTQPVDALAAQSIGPAAPFIVRPAPSELTKKVDSPAIDAPHSEPAAPESAHEPTGRAPQDKGSAKQARVRPSYPKCEAHDDCAEKGEFCLNRRCEQCADDTHCSTAEQVCRAGRCVVRLRRPLVSPGNIFERIEPPSKLPADLPAFARGAALPAGRHWQLKNAPPLSARQTVCLDVAPVPAALLGVQPTCTMLGDGRCARNDKAADTVALKGKITWRYPCH